MFSAPPVLLCDAIEKLEQLATALAEEPGTGGTAQAGALPPDRRLGKELLLGIRVLLPKLRTARHLHCAGSALQPPQSPAQMPADGHPAQSRPAMPYRACPSCEE